MDFSLSSCDNTGFQKHGIFQNYYYIALNKDTKWMCHAVQRKRNNSLVAVIQEAWLCSGASKEGSKTRLCRSAQLHPARV